MQDDSRNEDQDPYQEEVRNLVSMLEQGKLEGCNNLQELLGFIEEGNRASVQEWFSDKGLSYLHTYAGINRLVEEISEGLRGG